MRTLKTHGSSKCKTPGDTEHIHVHVDEYVTLTPCVTSYLPFMAPPVVTLTIYRPHITLPLKSLNCARAGAGCSQSQLTLLCKRVGQFRWLRHFSVQVGRRFQETKTSSHESKLMYKAVWSPIASTGNTTNQPSPRTEFKGSYYTPACTLSVARNV